MLSRTSWSSSSNSSTQTPVTSWPLAARSRLLTLTKGAMGWVTERMSRIRSRLMGGRCQRLRWCSAGRRGKAERKRGRKLRLGAGGRMWSRSFKRQPASLVWKACPRGGSLSPACCATALFSLSLSLWLFCFPVFFLYISLSYFLFFFFFCLSVSFQSVSLSLSLPLSLYLSHFPLSLSLSLSLLFLFLISQWRSLSHFLCLVLCFSLSLSLSLSCSLFLFVSLPVSVSLIPSLFVSVHLLSVCVLSRTALWKSQVMLKSSSLHYKVSSPFSLPESHQSPKQETKSITKMNAHLKKKEKSIIICTGQNNASPAWTGWNHLNTISVFEPDKTAKLCCSLEVMKHLKWLPLCTSVLKEKKNKVCVFCNTNKKLL